MKENIRLIALVVTFLLIIGAFCSLVNNSYLLTIILSFIVVTVLGVIALVYFTKPKTEEAMYTAFLKKIKKAFLTILISSAEIPNLSDKTIVKVSSIDDLVDISENVRKPIYYVEDENACDFILFHNDQACVYTLKMYEESTSKLEEYLKDLEEKKKKEEKKTDTTILEDLEKTTIIKITDGSLFKVSPLKDKDIREEKEKKFLEDLRNDVLPKLKEK